MQETIRGFSQDIETLAAEVNRMNLESQREPITISTPPIINIRSSQQVSPSHGLGLNLGGPFSSTYIAQAYPHNLSPVRENQAMEVDDPQQDTSNMFDMFDISSQTILPSQPSAAPTLPSRPAPANELTAHCLHLGLGLTAYLSWINSCTNFQLTDAQHQELHENWGISRRDWGNWVGFMDEDHIRAAWTTLVRDVFAKGYTREVLERITKNSWARPADQPKGTGLSSREKTLRRMGVYLWILNEVCYWESKGDADARDLLIEITSKRWRAVKGPSA